jgi:peptide/nickel transport system permease protein/oligopeptide transport system permease protein
MSDPLPQTPRSVRDASPTRRALRRFLAHRPATIATISLGLLLIFILFLPAWYPHPPNQLSENQWTPPSTQHWLGTDANGRDVLARVCAGTRVSLLVGAAGTLVSLVVGVLWGAIAGFAGGRWDGVLMRTVDILYCLPSILLVIVLGTALRDPLQATLEPWVGTHATTLTPRVLLIAGLGAVSWLTMARIVRAQIRSLRERPFILASQALGAHPARILFHHLLPNTTGVILVYLSLTLPAIVLAESFLSYLGLGIQPPDASLGSLLADGAAQINPIRTYWWLLAAPGSFLVLLLLAFGFVGDGLRDALDPRADH